MLVFPWIFDILSHQLISKFNFLYSFKKLFDYLITTIRVFSRVMPLTTVVFLRELLVSSFDEEAI